MKNTKSIVKYTVYGVLSVILFAFSFVILPTPIFKADDLNPLAVLFIVLPLSIFAQGILSGIVLKGRAKLIYLFTSPVLGVLLLLLFDLATSSDFDPIQRLVEYFASPLFFTVTLLYIIAGWMGVLAVFIFKKLRKIIK